MDEEVAIGECCADFYSHPLVNRLLDGIFHPGGLALSLHLAEMMGIDEEAYVLDVACGEGTTAIFLARKLDCRVMGIDVGEVLIGRAIQKAEELGLSNRTTFRQAVAGSIPFDGKSFTHVLSECSVCTFHDQRSAANEIHRVLEDNGLLGICDVTLTVKERLPPQLQSLLGKVACIADAKSKEGYIELFNGVGFSLLRKEEHSGLLTELVNRVQRNAKALHSISHSDGGEGITDETFEQIIALTDMISHQIESGNIGYDLFIFRKA